MPSVVHVLAKESAGELSGVDMHVLELAQSQAESGHRVVVIQHGCDEFVIRARERGIGVVSAQGRPSWSFIRLLTRTVRAQKADVVHAHGLGADLWCALARRTRSATTGHAALVFTQHGVVQDTIWRRSMTMLDALATRSADGVIACAPDLISRMRAWSPRAHVRYIPNGVGDPGSSPRADARKLLHERHGVPVEPPLLAYMGRLSPEKRPDRVLHAAAQLRSEGTPVHLLMAGAGPMKTALRQQADRLSLSMATTWTGLVRDVGVVYAAADVLALLSSTEATPRVIVEAMMAGTPVVASAVGGVPKVLGGGSYGHLVPEGDAATAVKAIRTALEAGREAAEPARWHAQMHYGMQNMHKQVAHFYAEVVARRENPQQAARIFR
ncbi:glycosyltransferase family 4 protein [Streptomyces sp. NPDC001665]